MVKSQWHAEMIKTLETKSLIFQRVFCAKLFGEMSSHSNFSFISSLIHKLSSQFSRWLKYFKLNSSTSRLTWHHESCRNKKEILTFLRIRICHLPTPTFFHRLFICHRVYSKRAPNSKQKKKFFSFFFDIPNIWRSTHEKTAQRETQALTKWRTSEDEKIDMARQRKFIHRKKWF